jgi:hypothetical protein
MTNLDTEVRAIVRRLARPKRDGYMVVSPDTHCSAGMSEFYHGRYIQIDVNDPDAPVNRRWVVTVIDRETGRTITANGPTATFATNRACEQMLDSK